MRHDRNETDAIDDPIGLDNGQLNRPEPEIAAAVVSHQRAAILLRDAVAPTDEPATVFTPRLEEPRFNPADRDASAPRSTGNESLAFATIAELRHSLDRRQVSSREVTELMLRRIEQHNASVNAYITVTAESALQSADLADSARAAGANGPLLGIPIALKDLFDTAGVRTTAGSRIMADRVPPEDATVVRKLREAGAVILGKTHMAEFAYGFPHPDHGPSRTPWNPSFSASGSSGGSGAAVGAGLAFGALGSDTGGSIRSPAAVCGITGLKPTYGLVSRYGVVPLSWSMDHAGPMTRGAEDAGVLLDIVSGYDPRDPASAPRRDRPRWPRLTDLEGVRVGVLVDLIDASEAVVQHAVNAAIDVFENSGAKIVEVQLPMSESINAIAFGTMEPEAATYHATWLREQPESYGPRTRNGLLAAMTLPATQYLDAQRLRSRFNTEVAALYAGQQLDLLAGPTEPAPPWMVESPTENETHEDWDLRHTAIANITGMPALALPCGFTDDGLPLSIQLFAPPFHDDLILRVGAMYQSATDWRRRIPPGFESV